MLGGFNKPSKSVLVYKDIHLLAVMTVFIHLRKCDSMCVVIHYVILRITIPSENSCIVSMSAV